MQAGTVPLKYMSLYDHLVQMRERGLTYWQASFGEVESIIGSPLPDSARRWRIFWSNLRQPRRASAAWHYAGWKTSNVNMRTETLLFQVSS